MKVREGERGWVSEWEQSSIHDEGLINVSPIIIILINIRDEKLVLDSNEYKFGVGNPSEILWKLYIPLHIFLYAYPLLGKLYPSHLSVWWLNTVFKKMKNSRFKCVFLDVNYYLLINKKYHYTYIKQHLKSLHKSYATVVAMATMTFQNGGHFGFKVI